MASTSSREAALERRRALTDGGKKAAGRFTSGPSRTRSASDARPSRTSATAAATPAAPAPHLRHGQQPLPPHWAGLRPAAPAAACSA
ncbi:hypothetical protein [Synechococcus sp. GFB01]|uniref:hypothetical protein n=1 Tax=Synechococcus sp. GFB01 TaxID=1662190 RepID=UPI001F3D2B2E|nr:hypothetical protein [Synechococcus sp. GFB01]